MMSKSFWLAAAAILGFLAVALGAFGAHSLDRILEALSVPEGDFARRREIYETAARYQMYHAVALLAIAWFAVGSDQPGPGSSVAGAWWIQVAAWCFLIGVLVFSGSLYGIVFTGINGLGAVTPIGGVALLLGWLAVFAAALRNTAQP